MTPVQQLVLEAGLPGSTPRRDRAPTVRDDSLPELIEWAVDERLTGLLSHAIEEGALAVESDDLANQAHDAHHSVLRTALAAESAAVRTVALLADLGIEAYAFKGVANAHLDYPDPSWRTFFDTDLHVVRSQFGDAIDALLDAGYTRTSLRLGARWERRFARACELRAPSGVEVDLHAEVATGYFGVVLDYKSLRADAEPIVLADQNVFAFSLPARALISCYSIALARGPGLRLQRDLAQQLLALSDRWREVVDLAGHEGAVVVAQSFGAVASMYPLVSFEPDALAWASTVRPTTNGRRALALAEDARSVGWSADARSMALALGPVEMARFGGGIAVGRLRRKRRSWSPNVS